MGSELAILGYWKGKFGGKFPLKADLFKCHYLFSIYVEKLIYACEEPMQKKKILQKFQISFYNGFNLMVMK